MKKIKNIMHKASLLPAMLFISIVNAVPASAQINISSLDSELGQVPTDVKKLIDPIINIVMMILGIAVIASLVVAYIQKRKDNNSNSNDKIIDALWTALVVLLGIYAVKFFFFR